ncbi:LAFA_0G18316g1_1 [Lachancea sp. 'fantastica']|nr:LAFA_0G18316g1_1 [Lachancea sp. 'fantastica']
MSFSSSPGSLNYNNNNHSDYKRRIPTQQAQYPSEQMSSSSSKPNSLYMGDLDPSWDEDTIRKIWASLGEPNVQVKLIRNAGSYGNNSGYCFVEFVSHSNASNALLKDGLLIPNTRNKVLKLNWATFATTPGTEHSIFVGDLAPNVAEAQLFELFISRYASTLNAKIVFDQITGVSKGYGFVKFGQESEQQRALMEMQGTFLNGRAIRVSTTSKNKNKYQTQTQQTYHSPQPQQQLQQNYSQHFPAATSGNLQSGTAQSQFIYPVQQQPALTQYTDPHNTTVFIGGLSALVTEEELRAYFQPFGSIVYVKIPVGKGCGFVQYVDRLSAETAISRMQGFPIGNSRIRLSWGRSAKQAVLMQQAFSSSHANQQQQQQQQQLQQPPQPQQLPLTSSNYPYEGQPAMPTAYGYSSTWDTLNGSYMPFSLSSLNSTTEASTQSSTSLLGGLSTLRYHGESADSPMVGNAFSYSPTYAKSQAVNVANSPDIRQSNDPSAYEVSSKPQFMDIYVRGKSETMDRLEKGSNGFIFA